MSKADEQMPLEIWTDINGNATRTQFKGGVKYIRADECIQLREQNRVLREVVDYIKQRCEPFQHGGDHGLKLHGGILPARIVAALTATSQEGQG